MRCDLCGSVYNNTIRVNDWVVCSPCSSNGVLKGALHAKAQLDRLRLQLRAANADSAEARSLSELARKRVDAAMTELNTAVEALVALVAQSTRSTAAAEKAQALLDEFEKSQDVKTLRRSQSEEG